MGHYFFQVLFSLLLSHCSSQKLRQIDILDGLAWTLNFLIVEAILARYHSPGFDCWLRHLVAKPHSATLISISLLGRQICSRKNLS